MMDQLATTTYFDENAQSFFANLSQDANPIHLDPLFARRTQVGKPIVHGINILLWALEIFCSRYVRNQSFKSINVRFLKPLFVNEPANYVEVLQNEGMVKIDILNGDITIAHLTISETFLKVPSLNSTNFDFVLTTIEKLPKNLSIEEVRENHNSAIHLYSIERCKEIFPNIAKMMGPHRIAALLATSWLVGMECPGLHSLYAAATFNLIDEQEKHLLRYAVTRRDMRFRSVSIAINGGGIEGQLETFVRHPPIKQPHIQEMTPVINPDDFSGQKALIIGGSRGLGEATAKIIAAGGGKSIITYFQGKKEALKIEEEIRAWGGKCSSLHYDIREGIPNIDSLLNDFPTHIYYFATCQIFRRKSMNYDPELAREFMAFYVDGFVKLCNLFLKTSKRLKIFYPSTIAIDQPVKGLAEYSMAKIAGETLCAYLKLMSKNTDIYIKRLPRILTDQTSTVALVESATAFDSMLPIIYEMR